MPVRRPCSNIQVNKASLVVDDITMAALYPIGYKFQLESVEAEVVAVRHHLLISGDDRTVVKVPMYSVRVGKETIDCRTKDVFIKTRHIPSFEGTFASILMDSQTFLINMKEGVLKVEAVVGEKDDANTYLDSYGWNMSDVILRGLIPLTFYLDEIPFTHRYSPLANCQGCGALRRLRISDGIQGDASATMYSMGTWDKEGPNKASVHCAWINEPPIDWITAQTTKNVAWKNNQKVHNTQLDDCGSKCTRFFITDEVPQLSAYQVKQEKDCIYVETPGWDIEVYV